MTRSIRKYTQNCRACTAGKTHTGKKTGLCQQKEKITEKLDTWHIDHAGPLLKSQGNTQILVVIDAFTKFVRLCVIKQRTAEYTIKALKQVFESLVTPRRIISDRALTFTSASFRIFLRNIELHLISTGMPRGNGQVERVMRTVFNLLRVTLIEKNERNWAKELPRLEDNINRLKSNATGATPVLLMTGEDERLESVKTLVKDAEIIKDKDQNIRQEIIKRLRKKQEAMKERFDKNRAVAKTKYKKGDLVMIQKTQLGGGKLAPRYGGQFKIITLLKNDRFALQRVNEQRRTAVAGYEQLRHWPEIKEN